MELGPYTLQVFTSLILILGAACVALICDFLKGNNEKLRELTIELKVRREEDLKRMELMMPHVLETPQESVAADVPDEVPEHHERTDSLEAPQEPAAPPSLKPQLVEIPSKTEPQRIPEQVLVEAMAASAQTQPAAPIQVIVKKKDWNSLLARTRTVAPAAKESPLLTAVMEATATGLAKEAIATGLAKAQARQAGWPVGLQDGFVVAELIARKQRVSGLVMSIGVSTPQGAPPENMRQVIQCLMGEDDFAVQSAPGEYLLICPNERGPAAQRRLTRVAQQLWDFQLHMLGTQVVMFSWGGLEVCNEPLQEAIASAHERMHETRRGRKKRAVEPLIEMEEPSRQAV